MEFKFFYSFFFFNNLNLKRERDDRIIGWLFADESGISLGICLAELPEQVLDILVRRPCSVVAVTPLSWQPYRGSLSHGGCCRSELSVSCSHPALTLKIYIYIYIFISILYPWHFFCWRIFHIVLLSFCFWQICTNHFSIVNNSKYLKVQPVMVLCVNRMGARLVRSVEHCPPGESPGIVSLCSVKVHIQSHNMCWAIIIQYTANGGGGLQMKCDIKQKQLVKPIWKTNCPLVLQIWLCQR